MSHKAMISASDLQSRLNDRHESPILLDATYGGPVDYTLPGARRFDIDLIADTGAPLPHTAPDAAIFEKHAQNLGVNKDSIVIVFDRTGFWMAAARAWWLFRLFGHDRVYVLDGGLPHWKGSLVPSSDAFGEQITWQKGDFKARFQPGRIALYDDVAQASQDGSAVVTDVRPAQAYETAHIPGAVLLPLPLLIAGDGRMRPAEEIRPLLAPIFEQGKPVISSCGSGVTACVLALAAHECGWDDAVAVYDGSWCEWRSRQDSNLQPTA